MSVVIKGGTIVTADRTYRADVLVEGETIAAVGPDLSGDEVIDAAGAYVMPGGIDPHTHMEMPFMGTTATDNFESGTGAALAGGTTTIVDFVLPSNGQSLIAALDDWHRKAEMARTDFSFHMAITYWGDSVRDEMEAVVKRGVTTFKHFMAYKGALMVDDDELYQSFCRVGDLGALALVHAENGDVVLRLQQKYMAEGVTGPEGHAYSRPPEVEGEATNRAIMVAGMAGTPLYIVHTSSIPAHEAIARARANGQRVFGEPLIQHLVLDDSEYQNKDWDHAAQRVMSPPFRNKKHQESLWNGLVSGSLQVVATDHCAFSTEQKRMGKDDFTKIPNGTGGLEDRMPVLWTHGVGTGRLTMNEFVAVTSTNIAKILNMYPRKGAIMPGADADIVIWDPEATKTISAATQKSAIDYNVFEGIAVKGLPAVTLSRGRVAYKDGQVQAKPGDGAFVPREPFTAATRALRHRFEAVAPQPVDRWVP
ncbi:dihydropyrimidinase [Fodinicurvata sp. EGI_FJ10296]|uniref:dihydropyrimidinase n=1 Tax=Fodinicurvata sp. EGI_FJ10296 TaxID=3231908 RepID=UPI003451E5C8